MKSKFILSAFTVAILLTASLAVLTDDNTMAGGNGLNANDPSFVNDTASSMTAFPGMSSNFEDPWNDASMEASLASSFQDHQFVMVSAGDRYTMAINTEGQLWAWGQNGNGQLGLGDNIVRHTPAHVQPGTTWKSVSVSLDLSSSGISHTMAINEDGELFAWGRNYYGQLGLDDNTNRNTPTHVLPGTTWKSVSVGSDHTAAINTEGQLFTWGGNTYGQLGLGSSGGTRNIPIEVQPGTTWLSVSAGLDHTMAINTEGQLWAWGENRYGQLGDGSTYSKYNPVRVGMSANWVHVSAGNHHTMAINNVGQLFAWGSNNGQLGLDTTTGNQTTPAHVSPGTTWLSVSAGGNHTMAINNVGQLFAWGNNGSGQLGLGDNTNRSIPTYVPHGTTWLSVSAGNAYTMAINADRQLFAWGSSSKGQLGFGNTTDRITPVEVSPGTTWKSVSIGEYHVMAINSTGQLFAWGAGSLGLGIGNTITEAPIQVSPGTTWTSVSAGYNHTLAINTAGQLFAWGNNGSGQLGLGHTTSIDTPTHVLPGTTWKYVSAGGGVISGYSMAINTAGQLFAWGSNGYGVLGVGATYSNRTTPTEVLPGTTWTSVSAGKEHTMAINTANQLFAWGSNIVGQLGLGDNTDRPIPTHVSPGTTWKSVSVGGAFSSGYTMAINTANQLFAWGSNYYNQLGSGDYMSPSTPMHILPGTTWKHVSASGGSFTGHTMAINTGGELYTWGDNHNGQLGLGDTTYRQFPTHMSSGTTWTFVSTAGYGGYGYTMAINTANQLFTWGNNHNGVLGLFNYSVPTHLTEMNRTYQYVITGSGTSLSATGHFVDGHTTYPVGVNTTLQNVIDAIRIDAEGNALTITFGGTGNYQDVSAYNQNIEFNGNASPGWGEITLRGLLYSSHSDENSGAISLNGNVTVNIHATIYNSGYNNGTAIYNNGGTVNIFDGIIMSYGNDHTIRNNGAGTVNILGGTVSTSGYTGAIHNHTGTINIYGGTVRSGSDNSNTINSANGSVVLGNNPTIIGNINVTPNVLKVNTSGTNIFAPTTDKTYNVTLSGKVAANQIVVVNGSAHIDRFTLTNPGGEIAASPPHIVTTGAAYAVTFNLNGGTGTAAPTDMSVFDGNTILSAPSTGTWSFTGWNHDYNWYTRTGTAPNYEYTPFIFGSPGIGTVVTSDVELFLIWTEYEYVITGSGTSFTVTKTLHNGTVVVASGVGIQNAIYTTMVYANTTTITFGNGETLDIGSANIQFNGFMGWGEITLLGSLTSSHNDGNSGTILLNGDVTLNNYADITNTGSVGRAIYNNGTGTVNILDGTVEATGAAGRAIHNQSSGTVNISGGTVQATDTSGRAIHNQAEGTINISGGTVQFTGSDAGHAVYNIIGNVEISGNDTVVQSSGNINSRAVHNESTGDVVILGGTVRYTGSAAGHAIWNNSTGTIGIFGGTVQSGNDADSNAIRSTNSGGSIILGNDPTIIGIIDVAPGVLSVIASGTNEFEPGAKEYVISMSVSSAGLTVVENGAPFIDNFELLSSWRLAELGSDIVTAATITFHVNGGSGTAPSPIPATGNTVPSAPPAELWEMAGWNTCGNWYTRTDTSNFVYTPFVFGPTGTQITGNTDLYLIWMKDHEYTITESGTGFTATIILHDGPSAVADNVPIQEAIDAIKAFANGNDLTITFGDGEILNIGMDNIMFGGTGWGEITLTGAVTSSYNNASCGVISLSDDMTVISHANITSIGANGRAIYNNGTGTVNIISGTVTASGSGGHAIHNASDGTIIIDGGTVQYTGTGGGSALWNDGNGTVEISGNDTVVQSNGNINSRAIHNTSDGEIIIFDGIVRYTGSAAGHAILNNGIGTISILNGTVQSGSNVNSNAIVSINGGNVILGGDPLIGGNIHVADGLLVVLIDGDNRFDPDGHKRYSVFLEDASAGMTAVVNGAPFSYYFVPANDGYILETSVNLRDKVLAVFTPSTHYRVTFDWNNGTDPFTEYVLISMPVAEPPAQPWGPFTFVGWFLGTTEWDFGTAVPGDMTLTAQWSGTSGYFTVTFDTKNGDVSRNIFVSASPAQTADEPPVPVWNSFRFDGWFHEGVKWDFTRNVTGDMTLTAMWSYIVTFNPNNMDDAWNEFVRVSETATIGKPDRSWIKYGYVTDGKWYIGKDGTTEFIFGVTEITDNILLYLNWNAAAVKLAPATAAGGEFGEEYSFIITASVEGNAAETVKYELFAGSLPAGLVLNASTGEISGIPTDIGEFKFTVRAVSMITDENDTMEYSIAISGGYYYWEGDDGIKFKTLSEALASGGSGTLVVIGSIDEDLKGGTLDFGSYVSVAFKDNADLTLSNGIVKADSIDISDGTLTLINATLVVRTVTDTEGNGKIEMIDSHISSGSFEASELKVSGEATIDGDVKVGTMTSSGDDPVDLRINGSLDADSVNITGDVSITENMNVTGDTFVDGNLTVGGSLVTGDDEGNVEVSGDLTVGESADIGGELIVGGNAEIGGELIVGGNAEIGGDLKTGTNDNDGEPGNVDIGGDLTVGGNAEIGGDLKTGTNDNDGEPGNVDIGGDLTVGGNAEIGGGLDVGGDADIGGDLTVGGDADIGGDLKTGTNDDNGGPGNVEIGGDLTVGGGADIGGDLTVGGDAIFGDIPEIGGDNVDIGGLSIVVKWEKRAYTYTGGPIIPDITVTNIDGTPLTDEYEFIITNNVDIGFASVSIKMLTGTHADKSFEIGTFEIIAQEDTSGDSSLLLYAIIALAAITVLCGGLYMRSKK